jgi:hypothetical protein
MQFFNMGNALEGNHNGKSLLYSKNGFSDITEFIRFIFDMNSTHGVKVNKRPIRKNTYVPLFGGHVFQIAGKKLFSSN